MSFNLRSLFSPKLGGNYLSVWIALAFLIVFGATRYDNFVSAYNISSFLGYNAMFVLISVGMCLVIMTGGIDLSVGTVAALSSVTAAYLSPLGLIVALPAGIATGLAVGALNAGMIVGMRLPPFMATLASMLAAKGTALWLAGNSTVAVDWTSNFTHLGMGKIGTLLPYSIIIALCVVFAAWLILEHTPPGRTVLAIGGNAEASRLMGLKTRCSEIFVYLFSGACAGLAGVFLASGYGAGQPLAGAGWELAAIAAVVVGGTLLTGGVGSVLATVAGTLLFGVIFNILNFENGRGTISISAQWQSVIHGVLLLIVIVLQARLVRQSTAY
ncbi:TPA: ABC transporter permease [Klebsiella pneumoniae]